MALIQVEGQSQYVLELQGSTWDHSTISVLVVPQLAETWWDPTYLNSTLRALSEWNEALLYFAKNYSDFGYLSRLNMAPEVSISTGKSFDVTISWIEKFENETCNAGQTQKTFSTSGIVAECNVKLAAYDCGGNRLSEVDMQNVALHEIGHVMVLGHANNSADLMYLAYSLGNPVRAVSTLDVYGVAKVFRWMAYSSEFSPDNQGQKEYSVSLPSIIEYQFLPISQENLPAQSLIDSTRSFLVNVLQSIQRPDVLIAIVIVLSMIVVIRLWVRNRGLTNRFQGVATVYSFAAMRILKLKYVGSAADKADRVKSIGTMSPGWI